MPPPLGVPPLPGLRLPLGRRRLGPGAALSLLAHAGAIVLLAAGGRELHGRGPGGVRGGGGGSRPEINFFVLPAAPAPTAIAVPPAPRVALSAIPTLRTIPIELPRLELAAPVPRVSPAAGAGAGGPGTGGGQGTGSGTAAGADVGPGTGGEGGYILASPRTAILPPLAKVPGSVAGRAYRVRFWVSAEGRVTRVEVEPAITDADYSREFQLRMMAYQFYPARARDGRNVASVVTVPLRIGN